MYTLFKQYVWRIASTHSLDCDYEVQVQLLYSKNGRVFSHVISVFTTYLTQLKVPMKTDWLSDKLHFFTDTPVTVYVYCCCIIKRIIFIVH